MQSMIGVFILEKALQERRAVKHVGHNMPAGDSPSGTEGGGAQKRRVTGKKKQGESKAGS